MTSEAPPRSPAIPNVRVMSRGAMMPGNEKNIRRFAVLQAGVNPKELLPIYGDMDAMFRRWMQDPDGAEIWDTWRVFEGNVPDDLSVYSAVIITGSKSSAHADAAWINQLKTLIRDIHFSKTRLLGVCFGHQIISLALGGISAPAVIGWESGVKDIVGNKEMSEQYPEIAKEPFQMLQMHKDQVSVLPEDAVLLASSEKCPIEMYQIPAKRPHILCCQFHPEYPPAFVQDLLRTQIAEKCISSEFGASALQSFEKAPESISPAHVRQFFKAFVKGEQSE